MSNDTELTSLVETLVQSATQARQRRAVLISGEVDWCRSRAQRIAGNAKWSSRFWIGGLAAQGFTPCLPKQATSLLGRECDLLVFDGLEGFEPDAFGAVSGCVRGGGLLLLLLPERVEPSAAQSSRFMQHLWRELLSDASLIHIQQRQALPALEPVSEASTRPIACLSGGSGVSLSEDQARAVQAVLHVVTGHRRRPLVLTSDRGRGKSSALGLAAVELLRAGRQVLITAPRRAAVEPLFERLREALPEARQQGNRVFWEQGGISSGISYLAPDELLQRTPDADLLMVDEAAAIPSPMLEQLLIRYSRIAFATTEHGYEGTGRGFAVRFREVLNRRTPNWRALRLQQPIRWAEGDPLEGLVFRCLLLDAEAADDESIAAVDPAQVEFAWVSQTQLLEDAGLLRQLFGLLVVAHYRTTPADLRDLLDAGYLSVLVARARGQVVGAALIAGEGGQSADLAWQVAAGKRRLPGHLVPQSLAAQTGFVEAAQLQALRVIRIAVHPALRQQGLGLRLLGALEVRGQAQGVDYLCSSFGATLDLLPFWARGGYRAVRLGHARDASSGTHSVAVLQGLSAAGRRLADAAHGRFLQQWPARLAEEFRDLEPALAWLLADSDSPFLATELSDLDWQDLLGYAFGNRLYESSAPVLRAWGAWVLSDGRQRVRLCPQESALLVLKVLQLQSWQAVAERSAFSGRKACEQALKALLRKLLPEQVPGELGDQLERWQRGVNP